MMMMLIEFPSGEGMLAKTSSFLSDWASLFRDSTQFFVGESFLAAIDDPDM